MRFSFLVLYRDMSIFNNIRLAFRYFYQKRSHFPQTMEVAVGVDRFDFIALAESEADLRLFAGMQFLALIALLGLERYPLDVMFRQHGMLHGADLDMDDAVFHCPDGDMLFNRGVGGAGNDLAHRLTAADDGNARVLDLGNDVAAMLANVKLLLHDDSPFFFNSFPREFQSSSGDDCRRGKPPGPSRPRRCDRSCGTPTP